MNKRDRELEVIEARRSLKKHIRPGTTVYTVLRHRSQSGMSRRIDVYVIRKNRPCCLTLDVSRLLGWPLSNKDEALVVGGCGMDMGHHVVYSMSSVLFPKGFKLAKNQHGRNGDKSGFDSDGGYAVKQEWL
jgi:hypothetical protein